jgi:predicted GIY-YIG superfamily endonuclease
MTRFVRHQRKTRPLVLGYLERIASNAFSEFPQQITELVHGKHGVYALYKGDRLYYVGLATNLRNRVKHHLIDKHAGKWTRFSLYLVRKVEHIKELESVLLRIATPKGNSPRVKGRLHGAENLWDALHENIRQEQERQLMDLLGVKKPASHGQWLGHVTSPRAGDKRSPSLAPYVNNPMAIRCVYKGKLHKARVRSDGTIAYAGTVYNSPSLAGRAVTKRATDGWLHWKYKNTEGQWVLLDQLRQKPGRA